ncbi:MAG: phosphotransferase, partial [Oscillospiraceae bacterium]|nr:phosphotransferase [Oscillospiraceae bacterium]
RVLMKVRKKLKATLPVDNVSSGIYDIFENTGFSQLLNVRKKLSEISVEGCEKLGQGGNGAVYRIEEDKIVKVYKPWMSLEDIDRERSYAKTAFVNGIPSVIAYDTVRVGDCLGVVFELLASDTLGHAMRDNPEKLEEYVDQYVALAKTLHSTHVPAGSFTRIQDDMHRKADRLTQWCTPEEIALLHSLIAEIPDADTVTHNDLHPGNIMIQNGELVLIDMPEVTMGPPICDLVAIFRDMISAPQNKPEAIEFSVGMPVEQIIKAGNLFFTKYTGITDPAALGEYFKKLGLLYALNVVLVVGAGSERAMQIAPIIMDTLLRGVVVPNEQAIRQLYKTM